MRASVPTSIVDNSYEAFPEGSYNGAISAAEIRDVNKDGSWLQLKVVTTDITPRTGTATPGRDRFQSDITIRTDGVDLFEVQDFSDPNLPFSIKRAAGLLSGLAEALQVGTRENGVVHADLKQVAEALVAGEFKGDKIGFQVSHYTNKETKKTYDQYNRFVPAS